MRQFLHIEGRFDWLLIRRDEIAAAVARS